MKFIKFLSILTVLILSSCTSSNEEPDIEYMGQWEIYYYENYHGLHNNSPEFNQWFTAHGKCFDMARFASLDGNDVVVWSASNGDWIELKDYERFYNGEIIWLETVNNATEDDIKSKVFYFESFSLANDRDKTYDKFSAQYRKLTE